MNYKLMVPVLLAFASSAAAQTPAPFPVGQCSTIHVEDVPEGWDFQREDYRIPGRWLYVPGNFCEAYARVGWEKTLQLYLGEGAAEYRELIDRAVEVWNETVNLPGRKPLIEVMEERPTNYLLPESFSSDSREVGSSNIYDLENVIYFKPYGDGESTTWGFAWTRWYAGWMSEADIYINTEDEEEVAPDSLILTKKLAAVDVAHGAYALYNKTYSVILHEIGHAVGLRHIPVNGNVMSRDFGAGGIDQWAATIAFDLFKLSRPERHRFVYRNSSITSYMRIGARNSEVLKNSEFFSNNAKLGEQEKMALACIYRY